MMTAEHLRREEAELGARLRLLPLADPEARREATEIRERLREIVSQKADIARLAAAAAETRVAKNLRRRMRKARAS